MLSPRLDQPPSFENVPKTSEAERTLPELKTKRTTIIDTKPAIVRTNAITSSLGNCRERNVLTSATTVAKQRMNKYAFHGSAA